MEQPPVQDALKAASMLWIGVPQSAVAQQLGVTVTTLRGWLKSDWWEAVARQAEEGQLNRLVGKARGVMDHVLSVGTSKDATARDRKQALDAAKFLLERRDNNFREPEKRVKVEQSHSLSDKLEHLTVEELRQLAHSGEPPAPKQIKAEVVDVDFEELTDVGYYQPGPRVVEDEEEKMFIEVPEFE